MKTLLLSDMKHKIKTGDLLAFTVRRYGTIVSFILWLYQKITRVKFSHVGVAMWSGNRLFIVEAVSPRVVMTPISKVNDFFLIPVELDKPPELVQADFLMDFIETPYSLIDMVTYYLGLEFSKHKVYCSTLASAFYYFTGFLTERESGHTPQKLVDAVLKRAEVDEPIHIVTDRGNL